MKARAASTRAGKVSKRLLNNTFMMAEAVEHVCDNHGYNRMEKKFVESLYDSRVRIAEKYFALIATFLKETFSFSRQVGLNFITEESTRAEDSIMTRL